MGSSARARLAACPAASAFVEGLKSACLNSKATPPPSNPAVAAALSLFDVRSPNPLCLAWAPGRLDVLGGVTDVFGGLSLQAITEEGTLVVAQLIANAQAHAGSLRVVSVGGDGGQLSVTLPLAALTAPSLPAARAALEAVDCPAWALYVSGSVAAVAAAHPAGPETALSPPTTCLSILIASALPRGAGLASSASLCTAVSAAVAAALTANADSPGFLADAAARRAAVRAAPLAAWRAETGVAGAPCGPADQAAVWRGEGGALLPVDCGTNGGADGLAVELGPPLRMPAGWRAVAISSGAKHSVGGHEAAAGGDDDGPPPYHAARAAGFMAAGLLPPPDDATAPRHFLCRRGAGAAAAAAALPATLTGAAWAARHGGSTDVGDPSAPGPLSATHPYPVRAAAVHAAGDAQRAWRVRRALEEGDGVGGGGGVVSAISEAMAASHAGYSSIGLGHPATDAVRDALLAAGPAAVAGARVSGGGAGGAVVALVADSAAGRAAADAASAAAAPWAGRPGGQVHWAARSGALGGAGFGVVDVRAGGEVGTDGDDGGDWAGL